MPLTKRLEWREGLFLDSASTLFFGGERSGSRELPEDNSSSAVASLSLGRMGSFPLLCLTRGAGWLPPHAFSPRSSSKRARKRSFSCCRRPARFRNSAICLACFFLFCFHILTLTKKLVLKGLICWVTSHNNRIRRTR